MEHRAARSSLRRGASAGAAAGLLASFCGAGYLAGNAFAWGTPALVFLSQLVLSGAAFGALFAKTRASSPPMRASLASTALVALPSAAFGTVYFGSMNAPFMGLATISSIALVFVFGIALGAAWLDRAAHGRRFRRAVGASVALALPLAALACIISAAVPDDVALRFCFQSPVVAGVVGVVTLGVLGVYPGATVGVVRRLDTPRVRVDEVTETEESMIDPLAEEEAELEAQFAELDRRENVSRSRPS